MRAKTVRMILALALGVALAVSATPSLAQTIELKGASQSDDTHPFNQGMLKFEEETKKCYSKPIKFTLYRNRELGLEKDYMNYMNQGLSMDYAFFAPSHAATFSKLTTLLDAPFLLRDIDHWNKVLSTGEALKPLYDDLMKTADIMMIGYAGGGVRNIVGKKPVSNMAELKGLSIRVMGAPIQTKVFQAIGAAPTVIAHDEAYNALQTGVIQAGENESGGWSQMKWQEVAPFLSKTMHAITIRPLGFSGKTFRKLPADLQACIMKGGLAGAAYGRKWERDADDRTLNQMAAEKKITIVEFKDRAKLLELTAPVKEAFAKDVGAEMVLANINAVK